MTPLDHVVTNIHWICVGGHHFDPKRVSVARSFKRLVPPACAFDQSGANRFRRAAIDVINDWFDGFTHRRRRVFFLQPMMIYITFDDWLTDRRREIQVLNSEVSSPRIVNAWPESGRRQLNK